MINEFRQDLVSGDWVLIAPGRAKRPGEVQAAKIDNQSPEEASGFCPFDDPRASGQEIVSEYELAGRPWITVIKNKYPAVTRDVCRPPKKNGPYSFVQASGFHEVVITADHKRNFENFTDDETLAVLNSFKDRYLEISKFECGDYVQIFNNSGRQAGASIAHPHSQILSTPIIPPMVAKSIYGAAGFYKKNGKRVHELMLEWERKNKQRIVFENDKFTALCPYASKRSYEIKIFPKKPSARFETAAENDLRDCAQALNFSLQRLSRLLSHNFSYNFFIHTAPVRGEMVSESADFYHWHIEIIPHFSNLAGFDFSTGIIVNTIDPDRAAEEIRNA